MRKRLVGISSLIVILGAYFVFRYPLFGLHGMKEFPLVLCVVGIFFIVVTGLIRKNKIMPITTVIGYIVGFFAGVLFEYDYGEGLNNMWIIWLWCFVAAITIGVILNLILMKKIQKRSV